MPDTTTDRGQPDRSRVSLKQEHELAYWTNRFGVSRAQLQEAVEAVGHAADAVERYLRR